MKGFDEVIILCADEAKYGIPGKWTVCGRCGDRIYLSDSSMRAVKEGGYKKENIVLNCFECAEPKIKTPDQMIPLSADQQNEIVRYVLKGRAQ